MWVGGWLAVRVCVCVCVCVCVAVWLCVAACGCVCTHLRVAIISTMSLRFITICSCDCFFRTFVRRFQERMLSRSSFARLRSSAIMASCTARARITRRYLRSTHSHSPEFGVR